MSIPPHRPQGFTLIELMVTIAIAATALAIAVPSYQAYARNATVSRAAASFVQAAHLARSNALRQSRPTVLALRDAAQGWPGGWIVFTDRDGDGAYTAGTDELIHTQEALADGEADGFDIAATGSIEEGYLRFNAGGFPRTLSNGVAGGTIDFSREGARSVRVIYFQTGRLRRCNIGSPGCDRRDAG